MPRPPTLLRRAPRGRRRRRHRRRGGAPSGATAARGGRVDLSDKGEHAALHDRRAEQRLRAALALLEERWGDSSSKLLAPCAELARVLSHAGRPEAARAFLERAKSLTQLKPSQLEHLTKLQDELKL